MLQDRADYNSSLTESWKRQILLNIVKVRYVEPLFFMEPPVESIEIPFEGTVLPGYFRKAATTNAPAKTLLLLGGAETFAEELFFYIGPQALARGYNLLTVDLPGQGLLPLEGLFFRPDMGPTALPSLVTKAGMMV